jgi:hypothetical protein
LDRDDMTPTTRQNVAPCRSSRIPSRTILMPAPGISLQLTDGPRRHPHPVARPPGCDDRGQFAEEPGAIGPVDILCGRFPVSMSRGVISPAVREGAPVCGGHCRSTRSARCQAAESACRGQADGGWRIERSPPLMATPRGTPRS